MTKKVFHEIRGMSFYTNQSSLSLKRFFFNEKSSKNSISRIVRLFPICSFFSFLFINQRAATSIDSALNTKEQLSALNTQGFPDPKVAGSSLGGYRFFLRIKLRKI